MSQNSLRQTVPLKTGWRFLRGDVANGMAPALDDSSWREVNVPHDWAIEGPFDRGTICKRPRFGQMVRRRWPSTRAGREGCPT